MVEMVQSSIVHRGDLNLPNIESIAESKQSTWSETNENSFKADFSDLSLKPEFTRSLPATMAKLAFEDKEDKSTVWKSNDEIWASASPKFNNRGSLVNGEMFNHLLTSPDFNNSSETLKKDEQDSLVQGIDSFKDSHLIKPAMLYRLIRQKVGPKEFELFSDAIGKFNSGSLSSEETVNCVSTIVKDRELLEQMKTHIINATR